ncbi:MAG: topoisomerase C-terminal repeat-containing protein [Firmicutes bacterium]|nr:topoisomerase C-terminal repeat-containing protein [Bacillota bacterium]
MPVGPCPLCGAEELEEMEDGWQCPECDWVLWREIGHRPLSDAEAAELCKKGKTAVLNGFRSKAGKPFKAALKVEDDGKVVFDFPERPPAEPVGKCPACGADVIEHERSYSCSAWRETGCSFALWKEIAGHRVTRAEATSLLRGEVVGPVRLKGRSGRRFRARLRLGEDHRVEFIFDDTAKAVS